MGELEGILSDWNAVWGPDLGLSRGVMDATFFSWPAGERIILERPGTVLFCKFDGGRLRVHLAVERAGGNGPGVYTGACEALKDLARERGLKEIVFGGGDRHLFPGIPLSSRGKNPSPWLRHFSQSGPVVMDFEGPIDLLVEKTSGFDAPGILKSPQNETETRELVDFVSREFPGRWAREIEYDAKNKLINFYFAYFMGGEISGYVRLYGWSPSYWGPGVYFAEPGKTAGGLGPIGVAASKRKRGMGAQILKKSWEVLKANGISKVRVDWTTETDFYRQRGLEIVQTYQPAILEL